MVLYVLVHCIRKTEGVIDHYCIHTHHFFDIDVPEAPLNVGATQSENECVMLVKWDPPANSHDIDHYIVYVSMLNMAVTTDSPIASLPLRDCSKSVDVEVAAVSSFGCIGINSSEVRIQLTPQSTSPAASESSEYNCNIILSTA